MVESISPQLDLKSLDQQGFGALLEPYRRELQAHCYRLMGSVQDAEDMVQESFLKAWRARESFAGRASLRAWLYKIATNACLDGLKKGSRRVIPQVHQPISAAEGPIPPPVTEPIWLEPYPDELLMPDHTYDPAAQIVKRETITLAFIVALHRLPPRQRAVLLLRDVLEWEASEVASLLEMTVSAVKSALHRARATLGGYGVDASRENMPTLDESAQDQLADYVRAWENADIDGLLRLLKEDATFSMPPIPSWYRGRDEIRLLTSKTIFSGEAKGRWRLIPTRANGQIAFGLYRLMDDRSAYAAYGIQVLTFAGDKIADIITFRSDALLPHFNLPPKLPV